ncbi:MAG: hypothetical protein HYZ63_02925, partial [Candidatus Andersenbacteria bacterium]|nr:hypothetical protein [Candidatus Andersenbacteria bacterium]
IILGLVAAAAGGGWYLLNSGTTPTPAQETIENPQEVLPGNAISITEYRFDTEERRQAINDFWTKQSGEQAAGLEPLLKGDPRSVTALPSVTSLFYITIPQESGPYVLVRETRETQGLFGNAAQNVVTAKGGWYIAHQTAVDPYVNALSQGNMAGKNAIQAFSEAYTVRIYAAQSSLDDLTTQITLKQVKNSPLSHLTMITDLPSGNILSLKGNGQHASAQAGTITTPDAGILYLVPTSIQFLRLGHSFTADVEAWGTVNPPLIDTAILQEPAVKQLIAQLSQSYAYYQRPIAGSSTFDLGLIIRLPIELKDNLAIGDPTLERSLFALTPLVTGTSQVTPLTFNDAAIENIPLRYVNLTGKNQALDYAIYGDYLFIATSKDGMATLLNAAKNPTAPTSGVAQAVNSLAGGNKSQVIAGALFDAASLNSIIPGLQSAPIGAIGLKAVEGLNRSVEAKIIFTTP